MHKSIIDDANIIYSNIIIDETDFYNELLSFPYGTLDDSAKIENRIDFYEELPLNLKEYLVYKNCSFAFKQGGFISGYFLKGKISSYGSLKNYGSIQKCHFISKEYDVDYRTGALIVALSQIEKVYKERGIFP